MTSVLPSTTAAVARTGHPLSFPQEQLWLIEGLEPNGGLYNEVWVLRVDGELDPVLLQRCLNIVIARHDVLRSSFHVVDGTPTVRTAPVLEVDLGESIDLATIAASGQERVIAEIAGTLADKPYDLGVGPLLRCSLLRIAAAEHVLIIGTHHIVADGWSLDVLIGEIGTLYRDLVAGRPALLPPLPVQYADFARWQRNQEGSDRWAEDLAYWREHLEGAPPVFDLSPGRLRPVVKGARGTRVRVDLPPGLATGARALALRTASTRACVLMSVFAAVLHRHTGREDLVVGTSTAGRPDEDFEPLVGFFANTLPLRFRPTADMTFAELLDHVTDTSLDALEHQDLPFARLVEELRPERDASYPPLVQLLFSHTEIAAAPEESAGIRLRSQQISRSRSRFDLLVETQCTERSLTLWVEFDDELFTESRVRMLCGHYENVLAAALRDPQVRLVDVPMLLARERGHAIAAAAPIGAPTPALDVVLLDSGVLAPAYAIGAVHQVHPRLGTVAGDRLAGDLRPTGELGYWTEDGELVRLASANRFPVVSGIRVPLDEVQAVIAVHPAVRAATVTAGPAGLVATVVATSALDRAELCDYLGKKLPKYAIPAGFEISGAWSVRPVVNQDDRRESALRDIVLTVLRDGLEHEDLAPDDDFFVVGGHSLLAAKLVRRLHAEHSLALTLKAFFRNPTARELAGKLARENPDWQPAGSDRADRAENHGPLPVIDRVPLTAAQTDIWVVDRLSPGEPVYNTPIAITISGALDVGLLCRAFDLVVARNPLLANGFGLDGGQLAQWPLATAPTVRMTSLGCLPAEQRVEEAARLRRDEAVRGFALDTEPPVRARLLVHHETHHELLLTFHHIAVDGVGLQVFYQELGACYRALREGRAVELPEASITWGDYAAWEARWVAGGQPELVDFWQHELSGLPQLELPTRLPRPQKVSFAGEHLERRLAGVPAEELLAMAAAHRVSPFMVTTAALAAVVSGLTGSTDVPIGTAAANRHLPDADRLIGCCISMLVLRLDLSGDPSFAELLDRVRDTTLDAYQHQGLPLPKLIRATGARRDAGRMALFQVASDWQEPDKAGPRFADCEVDWKYVSTGRARNDLSLTALRRGPHIDLELEYSTTLWTRAGADAWLRAVSDVVAKAVANPAARLSTFTVSGLEDITG